MVKTDDSVDTKFRLVHLLYIIIAAMVAGGIAWGRVTKQQEINIQAIDKKVSQDIYNQHVQQQVSEFESLEKTIDSGFKRMDKRLEKIEAK